MLLADCTLICCAFDFTIVALSWHTNDRTSCLSLLVWLLMTGMVSSGNDASKPRRPYPVASKGQFQFSFSPPPSCRRVQPQAPPASAMMMSKVNGLRPRKLVVTGKARVKADDCTAPTVKLQVKPKESDSGSGSGDSSSVHVGDLPADGMCYQSVFCFVSLFSGGG